MQFVSTVLATALTLVMSQLAEAAEIKVISGGAFRQVLSALTEQYQKETSNKVDLTFKTVGQHLKLIQSGEESFDVAVLTPEAIDGLVKEGKIVAGSRADLAKVGIGVVVKAGASLPDISTVEAFKKALLAAIGIAKEVNAKAVLVQGGAVADHIADGEAELGVHQISEVLAVPGVVLVGPLPAEIQNYTVYSAGVSAVAKDGATASGFVKFLTGPHALPIIKAKGMDAASS